MTLKELLDSVFRLKTWKALSENGTPGFDLSRAGRREPFVPVAEFKEGSQPMVRLTTRIGPAETPAQAVEWIARPAAPHEKLIYKTDVH